MGGHPVKLTIRESTGREVVAETVQTNIDDARSRALIDGIVTTEGEWLNPAHVVSIRETPDAN
jgi:hypothetical protein